MGPRFKKAMFVEYYSNFFMFETRQPDPRDETLHGPQLAANVGDRITIGIAFSIAEHCFFFFFVQFRLSAVVIQIHTCKRLNKD